MGSVANEMPKAIRLTRLGLVAITAMNRFGRPLRRSGKTPGGDHADQNWGDAEIRVNDIGDKRPEHDKARVGDLDEVEHAERDRHAILTAA